MNSAEIRQKFLKFFEERGHKVVPSSSLVPEGDSSVLFTTAGMQQFKPYYIGAKDPMTDFGTKNTATVQKSVRTSDIEEVGDERHLTFFEMLGSFSFDGYFKEKAIKLAHEFITKEMDLEISYVTVFRGLDNGVVPKDEESRSIWKSLGVSDIREEGMDDVFWGPTGKEGPCGPTTEIYVKNSQGEDIEIWNIVFNEFYCYGSREQLLNAPDSIKLAPLPFKGIDTGMGLERLAMVSQKVPTVFDTDLFAPIIGWIYTCANNRLEKSDYLKRSERIIADHIRAAVFIINDGITPGSNEREFIPRKLIKRAYENADTLNLINDSLKMIASSVINQYSGVFSDLSEKREIILDVIGQEVARLESLDKVSDSKLEKIFDVYMDKLGKSGMEVQIRKIGDNSPYKVSNPIISPHEAFSLYSTHGIPKDKIIKFIKKKNFFIDVDEFDSLFNKELKKHQEISRAGAEQKFKGGLAGHSDIEVRYHTATHLLHQALHDVLGDEVMQKGSNITPERTRFDFSFPRKLTPEEKKRVEDIVNEKIEADLPVNKVMMKKEQAEKTGARHFFDQKYPDEVSVYYIGDSLENAYSKEFCGGPHVERTGVIGKFRITNEESSSAGVRRIKAILE